MRAGPAPPAPAPAGGDAAYHEQRDFSLEDVRAAGERRVAEQAAEMGAAGPGREPGPGEGRHWERFHQMHSTAQFFKERRYLVKAFPELLDARCAHVLEAGCGTGSSAVALLRARQAVHVTGVDYSPTAVALAAKNVDAAGFSSRFSSSRCDICRERPPPSPAPGGLYDAGLMVFTLSAIPPAAAAAALRNLGAGLREGARLLVRDYGVFDMAMLRFKGAAAVVPGELYRRSDGTLARFMTLEALRELVREVPELEWDDGRYNLIKLVNRKTDTHMHRVFVEARLTYRGGG